MLAILRRRAAAIGGRNVRFASGLSQEQVEKTYKLMKNISLFGVPLAVGFAAFNAYTLEKEHMSHPRPEYVPYPYLQIMNKPWPWGDGKHSFFHNPKTNYVRDVGYEEDWP